MSEKEIERVLAFWFGPEARESWFGGGAAFDRRVREALGRDHEWAAAGNNDHWMDGARGCLALVILLDQVPRNIFRGQARAFATDARAREVSRHALARGFDRGFSQSERMMLCLPLEHSEDPADQERCVGLMASLDEDPAWLDYSRRHRDVIARFGRFPGRNAALGRETTAEEAAFLTEPGSSFEGKAERPDAG